MNIDVNAICFIAITQGGWGRGDTIDKALSNLERHCGRMKKGAWASIYIVDDAGAAVDGVGRIQCKPNTFVVKCCEVNHMRRITA